MFNVHGERLPEGGRSSDEGFVIPGSVVDPLGNGKDFLISKADVSCWDVVVKELGEVGGGQGVEGFEGDEEDLELDVVGDGGNGADGVTRVIHSDKTGSRVLDIWEFTEKFEACANENTGRVIKSGCV